MSDEDKIDIEDPSGGESNFGGIVTAVGFDETVEFLARVVPKSTELDPNVVGEIVAAALSLGGYIGAELCCEGIEPPTEERTEFARKFPGPSDAIGRIKAHTRAAVEARFVKRP